MIPPPEPATQPFTIIVSEKGGADRRELFTTSELNVGRVQGNELMLPKGNVSKRHARLLFRDGRFIVTDLNSTNGTYVNRRRIAQATIVREGDRIYIGDFVLRIELGAGDVAPASEEESSTGRGSLVTAPDQASEPPTPLIESRESQAVRASGQDPNKSSPSISPADRRTIADAAAFEQAVSSTHERDIVAMAAHHREMVYAVLSHVFEKMGAESFGIEVADGVEEQARTLANERAAQLSESGDLHESTTKESVASDALAELMGLGPLESLMDEPGVSSIAIPRFDRLTVTRQGRLTPVVPTFSCEWSLNMALSRLAAAHDATPPVDDDVVDLRLDDGTWLSMVRGTAAPTGTLAVIRRPRRIAYTLEKLVRRGTVSRNIATFLQHCVSARLNILIVGPLDEGSSMLLSALCAVDGEERVIALSDADDVVSHIEAATRLNVEGAGRDSTRLLQIASRIPEARLAATLSSRDLAAATLEAIGDGITGVIAAIRATDLRRALGRLPADLAVARPGMSVEAAREWVRSSFDVLIEVARLRDGRIRALRVAEFAGLGSQGLELRDIFTFVIERVATGGAIEGSFTPGERPQVLEQMRALGIEIEDSAFSRPSSA